jgi:DNA-binding LacI/PurR family transcriptional regulator
VAGAREAFFAADLEPPKAFYRIGDPRDASFVRELIGGRKIDGVICANDLTAAQLMHSLAKAKVRVPDDIRLIGFDNLKYAELFSVPLTTVSQPLREMGANAIRAMLSRLADPTFPPITLLSNPQLIVRASCGAFMQRSG